MRGDDIKPNDRLRGLAEELRNRILPEIESAEKRYVLTIAGESGAGKTTLAYLLTEHLNRGGINTILIQQDDYFVYPPVTNYEFRRENLASVGVEEVRLSLLQRHVRRIKDPGEESITKPLIFFNEDHVWEETLLVRNAKAVIIEGTYVTLLEDIDKKIFLSTTYKDTREFRVSRAREKEDDLSERILEIEHDVIREHARMADIVVNRDYTLGFGSRIWGYIRGVLPHQEEAGGRGGSSE